VFLNPMGSQRFTFSEQIGHASPNSSLPKGLPSAGVKSSCYTGQLGMATVLSAIGAAVAGLATIAVTAFCLTSGGLWIGCNRPTSNSNQPLAVHSDTGSMPASARMFATVVRPISTPSQVRKASRIFV
jgi:hypothetical protein